MPPITSLTKSLLQNGNDATDGIGATHHKSHKVASAKRQRCDGRDGCRPSGQPLDSVGTDRLSFRTLPQSHAPTEEVDNVCPGTEVSPIDDAEIAT